MRGEASVDSALVRFHAGVAPDDRGRRIQEILNWGDDRLESVHDYIQWLFPLPERSAFNPGAPVLTQTDIAAFRRPELRASLEAAFRRMLDFYGFEAVETEGGLQIIRSRQFSRQAANWLNAGNHNLLRISRILRSLTLLGLEPEGRAFLAALEALYDGEGAQIGAVPLSYWREAVR